MQIEKKLINILSKLDDNKRLIRRESMTLEFKENFNFSNLEEYSKIMSSFANNKGGIILFGIKDSPRELLGINYEKFNEAKQEKITSFLLDYFSVDIEWEMSCLKKDRKYFGYVYIKESKNKPIICKKTKGKYIKNGSIYYRYNSQSRNIEYPELSNLIFSMKKQERDNWMSLMTQIASIGPENSAVLDFHNKKISGEKGTLVIDEKLVSKLFFIKKGSFEEKGKPTLKLIGEVKSIKNINNDISVKTTNNPNAPEFRLTEKQISKLYPIDYQKLTLKLKNKYKNFKIDSKYHKIRRKLIKKGIHSYRRLLNPNNPKSSYKDFFSNKIVKEFDKHYYKK